ncbi:MAG: hypothetical protein IKX23_03950 [Treponema sp.]|nr:hypothetical protein [Treponema sp.]
MKKTGYIFLVFLLISCKNSTDKKIITFDENSTLKAALEERSKSVIWSKEINPEILKNPVPALSSVQNEITVTPPLLSIINDSQLPVYPSIPGFANLDVSKIPQKLITNINSLCKELCKGIDYIPENVFIDSYKFNAVFFRQNLIDIQKEKGYKSYIIGNFDESFDLIQVPVRLTGDGFYVDIEISARRDFDYLFEQIDILRWE